MSERTERISDAVSDNDRRHPPSELGFRFRLGLYAIAHTCIHLRGSLQRRCWLHLLSVEWLLRA